MPRTGKSQTRGAQPQLTDFAAWEARLRRVYVKANKVEKASDKALRPGKQAMNRFRLAIYGYYHDLRQAKLIGKLREHVEKRDGSQWTGHGEGDELWVLRLATKDEQTASRRKIRSRLAAELRLASLNGVRPDLLLGFLYEVGTVEMIEKAARKGKKSKWAEAYR
jgi:hypothetical protein